jgi:hypothetical protein
MSIREWRGKPVWRCGSLGGSSHVLCCIGFSKPTPASLLVNIDGVGHSETQTDRVAVITSRHPGSNLHIVNIRGKESCQELGPVVANAPEGDLTVMKSRNH